MGLKWQEVLKSCIVRRNFCSRKVLEKLSSKHAPWVDKKKIISLMKCGDVLVKTLVLWAGRQAVATLLLTASIYWRIRLF